MLANNITFINRESYLIIFDSHLVSWIMLSYCAGFPFYRSHIRIQTFPFSPCIHHVCCQNICDIGPLYPAVHYLNITVRFCGMLVFSNFFSYFVHHVMEFLQVHASRRINVVIMSYHDVFYHVFKHNKGILLN